MKIIETLDNKLVNTKSISNYLINIYQNKITNDATFNMIKKYFDSIYTKVYNDYWDLDRYENSDYNTTNESIIQILKLNVIGIIKNELINTLINYIYMNDILEISDDKKEDLKKKIKEDNNLKKSIEIYLYQCLINKLGLFNPEKTNTQINIDEQKTLILNTLQKKLSMQFDETTQTEIKKIIEFNKFICENIGLNCYEEITKILNDGKKISIYYNIYDAITK